MGSRTRERIVEDLLQMKSDNSFHTVDIRNKLYAAIRKRDNDRNLIEILEFAKNAGQTTFRDVLISTNKSEGSALHCATIIRNVHALTTLLNATKDLRDHNTTLIELLLSRDELGETALHYAARTSNFTDNKENVAVAKELLNTAEGIKDNDVTLKQLLLSRDEFEETALHDAAKVGDVNIVEILLDFAKKFKHYGQFYSSGEIHDWISPSISLIKELLLSRDEFGDTALHSAAKVGSINVVSTLLLAAYYTKRKVLEKLLISTNILGDTVLHSAAKEGDVNVVNTLLLVADYTKRKVLEKLLISTNKSNQTALHDVAERWYNCIISWNEDICREKYTRTLENLLLAARHADVLLESSGNATVFYTNLENDIGAFINFLKNTKYVKNYTLKKLLSLPSALGKYTLYENDNITLAQLISFEEEGAIQGLSCNEKHTNPIRSKRSIHQELENVIDQDSSDNLANTEHENVDAKSSGWLQWLANWFKSLEWPSFNIFTGADAVMITDKIVHSEEYEYLNQTNYIAPSISNVGRALNSSNVPLISNDNNDTVQKDIQGVALDNFGNTVLFAVFLMKMLNLTKIFDINTPLYNHGNNYILPKPDHTDMKVNLLVLNDNLSEDDLINLLFQGDVREYEPE